MNSNTETQPSKEEKLSNINREIESFAERYIHDSEIYLSPRSKIIHDTLWGTILFEPAEIVILDLPLIQRLRQIRQTSLVYYTYPSCTHSRFGHTLGVVFQTQKLMDTLIARGYDDFGPDIKRDIRMAAIFHDVGHSAFSHLSEEIYRFCDDMQFLTEPDGPFPQRTPHEVLSHLILKSEPVIRYFNKMRLKKKGIGDYNNNRMADWILGIPENNDNKFRFRAEILNGPFDADKLDYIFRDGYFSGLPLGLDLDRLWASCDISLEDKTNASILTLSQNSATPLEQILFNKINLFSVVYHHPKVRACECMVKGLIEYLRETPEEEICGRKLKNATDFLWITDDSIFAEALKRDDDCIIHRMIHDVLYRRFYVRALTLSNDTVKDIDENIDYWNLRELNQKTAESQRKLRELAYEIWEEAGRPHTKHHIWLDLPHDPPTSEADRVHVRYLIKEEPGYSLRKLSELFPLNYWVQLYTQYKWRGHVFCPRDCQQVVYEAAKRVFEKRNIRFKKSAGEMSHVPNSFE